jgi:hypothetical protein
MMHRYAQWAQLSASFWDVLASDRLGLIASRFQLLAQSPDFFGHYVIDHLSVHTGGASPFVPCYPLLCQEQECLLAQQPIQTVEASGWVLLGQFLQMFELSDNISHEV